MAGEEDVELRDLIAHTLESRGVLGRIRAQLRANVFLALEEQESQQKPHPLENSKLQQYLKTKDGQVATALVREFLSFFELDYTCSVFDPETNALESCPGRSQLAQTLGLDDSTTSGPLLDSILRRATTTISASHQPPNNIASLTAIPRNTDLSMDIGELTTSMHASAATASLDKPTTNASGAGHSVKFHNPKSVGGLPPLTEDGHAALSRTSSADSKLTMRGDQVASTGTNSSSFATIKEGSTSDNYSTATSKSGDQEQMNGKDAGLDDLDDFFSKKFTPHLDDGHLSAKSSVSSASKVQKSETQVEETEDYSLSETSLGTDYDYVESAKT